MEDEIKHKTELNGSAVEQVSIQANLQLPPQYAEFLKNYVALTGVSADKILSDGVKSLLEMFSSDMGRLPGDFPWRLENQ